MSLTLVTGGVRSGKSAFAEKLAEKKGDAVLYVAFGVVTDEEMERRIVKHKKRRPEKWGLLEEPNNLIHPLPAYKGYDVVLIDCLSTWITNQCVQISEQELKEQSRIKSILKEVQQWLTSTQEIKKDFIVVTSETGLGGVAMSPLGRTFQDLLGEANQLVAQSADEVYAVLSGIPMRIKS